MHTTVERCNNPLRMVFTECDTSNTKTVHLCPVQLYALKHKKTENSVSVIVFYVIRTVITRMIRV